MFEMFYFKEEVQINDINKMTFTDFIKHETVLCVETNLSKKQLNNFRKKIKDKSFYPVYIIRKNQNDTVQVKQNKLQNLRKENIDLFKKRYKEIAKKKFGINSLFEIKNKIRKCPFCKHDKVEITHNYSKEYTNCNLYLICTTCNEILDSQSFFKVIDASYVYNETINKHLNLYCKNYNNKLIEKKIFEELKNTETVEWL